MSEPTAERRRWEPYLGVTPILLLDGRDVFKSTGTLPEDEAWSLVCDIARTLNRAERVVPEPDDTTRAKIAADVAHLRAMRYHRAADYLSAAYLSGDREERSDTCPTCGSDDPADRRTELSSIGAGCAGSWHGVGVSR